VITLATDLRDSKNLGGLFIGAVKYLHDHQRRANSFTSDKRVYNNVLGASEITRTVQHFFIQVLMMLVKPTHVEPAV
jgi:hypothetical protein